MEGLAPSSLQGPRSHLLRLPSVFEPAPLLWMEFRRPRACGTIASSKGPTADGGIRRVEARKEWPEGLADTLADAHQRLRRAGFLHQVRENAISESVFAPTPARGARPVERATLRPPASETPFGATTDVDDSREPETCSAPAGPRARPSCWFTRSLALADERAGCPRRAWPQARSAGTFPLALRGPREAQRPWKLGLRFSAKAASASRRSVVPNTRS